ncbi:MAG TPA: FkbM family methyltransferase [Solirubrobacteraceae bacterium]|jgi:FkbM family methyltransferase|nr:FkbM family methyltransferase [Solirubrobacteraceae bacterium]
MPAATRIGGDRSQPDEPADPPASRSQRWWSAFQRSGLRRTRVGKVAYRALHLSSLVVDRRLPGSSRSGVLARLWLWQVWRRTIRRPVLIRCAEGSLLLSPHWSRAAGIIAGTGLTERDDAIFVLDLLRAGDLFVDVGANIGFYTVLAARRGARVEAFEPAAEAFDACTRNVDLNRVAGLARIHRAACGATSGVTHLTTGLDISNHIVGPGEGGVEVPISRLDDCLAGESPLTAMLKIDAEGHDLEVLAGALESVERMTPVILVEIWTGGAGPLRLLERFGYRAYDYDPAPRTLTQIASGHRQGGNMLLICDETIEAVRRRVQTAERPVLRSPSLKFLR